MSQAYWQAKIWGLLHDPAFKALAQGQGDHHFWENLPVMEGWEDTLSQHIRLADALASACDRGTLETITSSLPYHQEGVEITHLLSGKSLNLKLGDSQHEALLQNRQAYLAQKTEALYQAIPAEIQNDPQALFWWLWRCLPEAACQTLADPAVLLLPAETRFPDSSIWSHGSLTAALAGALAGYDTPSAAPEAETRSLPYLASFTFTPVQELIKASRKMRDFWAGSWLLHYLSAKVSWRLAQQYGPDCLLYPSLYQQPLIDHWLLQDYPQFRHWVESPQSRSLLTAGFPNVIVVILPQGKVAAAMQMAKSTLLETWREIGEKVIDHLQSERYWLRGLEQTHNTWQGWLNRQWQTYWTAMPIGVEVDSLQSPDLPTAATQLKDWQAAQNQAYNAQLFHPEEEAFFIQATRSRFESQQEPFQLNVGSWWANIFDATRLALASVKNARNWVIPTAFGTRSTISGMGPVVHPGEDWYAEGESQKDWQQQAGLFDGREQLNATETLKRGLEKVLPELLNLQEAEDNIAASYPDLTAGVGGYLKVNQENSEVRQHFRNACAAITQTFPWARVVLQQMRSKWGIPWIDEQPINQAIHSRLLNAGWLVEDAQTEELQTLQTQLQASTTAETTKQLNQEIRKLKQEYRQGIQDLINRYYPSNNPANWYVLAAGDGDGMSQWLKGEKLKNYQDYIPAEVQETIADEQLRSIFQEFLNLRKRMGPSTHNALSRALLDFSNQLLPYLTEERYAGRLIYGGGDDVLAYTNLWEWDKWLWDIHQCFRGENDPQNQFSNRGDCDYWQWIAADRPESIANRPLFTMGHQATISFGVILAHHSVPLAIALENLWEAEAKAKDHVYQRNGERIPKDAVQVRILYSNGNILKATCKFGTFQTWQNLLATVPPGESAIFEQASLLITQHPIPVRSAIAPWTSAFVSRREILKDDQVEAFRAALVRFLEALWDTTPETDFTAEVANWLKLAAFVQRNREIKLGGQD